MALKTRLFSQAELVEKAVTGIFSMGT